VLGRPFDGKGCAVPGQGVLVMSISIRLAGICLSLALGATCALAQVEVKSDAVIYFGSATTTSAPAMIDEQKVREATPEWQTIQAEGVRRGTARYMLLQGEMDRRIRAAARLAAAHASKDLVVRTGDITNDQGRPAVDLTSDVIAKL
jgi:hypothetical protein